MKTSSCWKYSMGFSESSPPNWAGSEWKVCPGGLSADRTKQAHDQSSGSGVTVCMRVCGRLFSPCILLTAEVLCLFVSFLKLHAYHNSGAPAAVSAKLARWFQNSEEYAFYYSGSVSQMKPTQRLTMSDTEALRVCYPSHIFAVVMTNIFVVRRNQFGSLTGRKKKKLH